MADSPPLWYLLGAGNMGTLATHYLNAAGFPVIALRRNGGDALQKTLNFTDGRPPERLILPVAGGSVGSPIQRLIVACKTPYTAAALDGLPLADSALVLRLQNGLGSLDGLLPESATLIEVVTTTAVKGTHPEHTLVAENQTWMGPGGMPAEAASTRPAFTRPDWFEHLARHWPGLEWADPIRHRQWHKLVANAVINPLTGLQDLPNGALLEHPALRQRMATLAEQADTVLGRLDPTWPGDSLPRVLKVVRATAGNTSSMRADMQRGAVTEIEAINGWLLRQAAALGLDLAAHRDIVAAVKARHARASR